MSPINVGGDGSVQWEVEVKKGKAGKINSSPLPHPGGHYNNAGSSDTDPGQRFAITIKHPKDQHERDAFRQQLYDAWVASNAGAKTAAFSIPIEDDASAVGKTTDQIVIDWSE
jgi:hypothetical protein